MCNCVLHLKLTSCFAGFVVFTGLKRASVKSENQNMQSYNTGKNSIKYFFLFRDIMCITSKSSRDVILHLNVDKEGREHQRHVTLTTQTNMMESWRHTHICTQLYTIHIQYIVAEQKDMTFIFCNL